MATYRFLAYTLVAPVQAIAELPLTEVTYTQALNDAGTLQAKLVLTDPLNGFDPIRATEPNEVAIYVERDGVLLDGYMVRTRTYDSASMSLTIGGSSFIKYYEDRLTGTVGARTNFDPVYAARLAFASAETAGNSIGLTIGTETSPARVDIAAVDWKESKTIIEYVNNASKAGVDPTSATQIGFDYAIDVAWHNGSPMRTLSLGYPRRGRSVSASNLMFDSKVGAVNYTYPEDGASQGNYVQVIGQGIASTGGSVGAPIASVAQSTTGIGEGGYPLLQKAVTGMKDVTSQRVIDARSQAELAAADTPAVTATFLLHGEFEPKVGTFIMGDMARAVFGPDPRFPTALSATMRIVAMSVELTGSGSEELLTVTLNQDY